jgi:pimeloyl-ACP methyl ester carboxylesterase
MRLSHDELDVAVSDGGTIRVTRWGAGPREALAVHGITASGMCWQPVARALPEEWSLFAPDLRGRGHSAALGGPYGLDRHVADVLALVRLLGLDRPVLTGHSMGAYVALLAVAASPADFGGLLLLDGGLPLPVPSGADLDDVLAATLGPALSRLSQTFPSEAAYLDFWRAHPAFTGTWNPDIEDYVRYDLTGPPGALRSRAVPDAVRADGRDLLSAGDRLVAALRGLSMPVHLLSAPAGMFGKPPGILPPEVCSECAAQAPMLTVEAVPGTNHYTLQLDYAAAAVVADRLVRQSHHSR